MTTPASDALYTKPVSELTPAEITRMQKLLKDWPQIGRYQAENSKLGPPAAGEHRVVFFGDSITDNWGRRFGKFFPQEPWLNRGISGQTTPQMLARFEQDVIALHPEAVVILAGINDISGNTGPETLDQIQADFRAFLTLAQAAHIRVVLCSVLPARAIPWRPGIDPREEAKALNDWLQQLAAEQHLVYANYFPAMAAPDGGMRPELSKDGVHPNDAGYAIMEPIARQAVEKALSQPRP